MNLLSKLIKFIANLFEPNKTKSTMDRDIIETIKNDFGKDSEIVAKKFEDYLKTDEWVSHEKVLRSVLKLAEGDISKIDKYLKMANADPRDVVMLADDKP